MRAVIVPEPGDPDALVIAELPTPEPGPGEVQIEVAAAGVNRADLLQRQGHYDPPPGATPILGLECSGVVTAVGTSVNDVAVGSQVCALLSGGGYAEYVTVPAGQVAKVPSGVQIVDAAALMEVAATVWSNVFMMAKLQAGETLLVHGGASGIGTMAIQLGKAFGARVVVTAGSARKLDVCRALGADVCLDYTAGDFSEELASLSIGADVILDIIGAKYLASNIRALNTSGRLVVIGLQGGVKGELNLGALLAKRAAVMATSLRARPSSEKSAIVANMVAQVWPLLSEGTVKPVVDRVLPLERAAEAHRALEESDAVGKVLLTP